jgi:glucose-6-phosphate isomerase
MGLTFTQQFDFSQDDISDASFGAARARVREAVVNGSLGFMRLPHEDVSAIKRLADEVVDEFKAVVVIGIGGSDLGTRAVQRALNSAYYNMNGATRSGRPKLFFAGDTTDPVALAELIDVLNWNETALIMVSKSGNTVEQMSTFLFLRERLIAVVGEEHVARHIVAITDANKGTLHDIAVEQGYRMLPIPDDVGGRFSVLTPVGLLPLAIAGIDIDALLSGAGEITIDDDAPFEYAVLQYLAYTKREQRIHVIMPYTYGLRDVGFWFRQLWAESLGKALDKAGNERHVGPTPIAAVGPTDQHSQVQLYREGLNDKTFTFVSVTHPGVDFTLPDAFQGHEGAQYLAGHTFNEIVLAERESTDISLREVGRPTCHIALDHLDAAHVGQLLQFFELATAYAGELFDLNAYDQPGVERGKEIMYKMLGRFSREG